MRAVLVAFGLILALAAPAAGFETEEDTRFAAVGGTEQAVLSVLSTTDTDVLRPVIAAFQARNPGIALRYTVANSQQVFAAINDDGAAYDLVISSAMDLQMKLANDGLALPLRSEATGLLPEWARWQDLLFAFAQEPVVLIMARAALDGAPVPRTRRELTQLLRDHPERFIGRIGTYDPETSGAGYLFVTQDARLSDTFWRLAEVMGGLAPQLYDSSAPMIADLKSGRLVLAYNVLGSYAAPRLAGADALVMVELEDHTLTLLRTALVPITARAPELGALFLDFLLGAEGRKLIASAAGLPPIDAAALSAKPHLRVIRLDAGLLVYLDVLKRRAFLEEWQAALIQP
ncbi:MAG: ABC transporter substrate-binding protein [Phaeovulum sp.]|uniref:ABC transporter substrate-binding protein n=1 Tax=Phaeovulum sp. TaxID=2934796 RepID=UPI0027320609|nr:ABC transporter substrate-binding protein [Phaeovulum sp.]MDP2062152.1 ABC transporter substrate-binding protein [Phaeovulum sp.]